jgi:hypothetical protein
MTARRSGACLCFALALLVATVALASIATPAAAQAGPQPGPQCPNYMDLASSAIDPELHVTIESHWDDANRGIAVSWSSSGPSRCSWFQMKLPGADYPGAFPGSPTIAWADFVLAPGPGARIIAVGSAGRHCFRLFALSLNGRSEPAESCTEVSASALPTPAPPGTGPQPSGTPWPAPQDVQLTGHTLLLDKDNFPLPPDLQTWFAGISWSVLPGFTGTYEVQRARSGQGPLAWESLRSGRLPASLAREGRIGFEEQVTPLTFWCFRVRTVVNGEVGPFSQPVCMPQPPSDGGGAEITPAPLPPDVGNAVGADRERGVPTSALIAAAVVGMAGAVVVAMRGR